MKAQLANEVHPRIAVALLVREKFGVTIEALRSLYERTGLDFRLLLVVNAYPDDVLHDVREYLRGKRWVTELPLEGHFRLPNEALNAAMASFDGDYLVVVDNDMVVEPGYLEAMISTAERIARRCHG